MGRAVKPMAGGGPVGGSVLTPGILPLSFLAALGCGRKAVPWSPVPRYLSPYPSALRGGGPPSEQRWRPLVLSLGWPVLPDPGVKCIEESLAVGTEARPPRTRASVLGERLLRSTASCLEASRLLLCIPQQGSVPRAQFPLSCRPHDAIPHDAHAATARGALGAPCSAPTPQSPCLLGGHGKPLPDALRREWDGRATLECS